MLFFSEDMSQAIRRRGGKKTTTSSTFKEPLDDLKEASTPSNNEATELKYLIAAIVVTLFAIYTRFVKLGTPDTVVFDEVHFGKFASYYLERTYFFDLHPPFAKLLIAFVGYIIGYDGSFKFDNIGDNYIRNNVPYVAYRSLLAIQGVATIPIMFYTMKTLGFSVAACFLSSIMVCFDNAHITDSRLILLDATLLLSVALTVFCYSKFSTYRRQPFSKMWWAWLSATGFSLSCVISTKYVGVFTYVMIGIAVVHELWILLDYRKGLTIEDLAKHFFARLWCLILVPFTIYLFWFYLHFQILIKSGPGDSFMSSDFQETLGESELDRLSKEVRYYDIVTFKHKDTESLLHSHLLQYPLRYEDGRISSNSQQVTCVKADSNSAQDPNNQWQIIPAADNKEQTVYTNDIIRLKHVGTGGYLLTHDVASPLLSTNEEFTIVYDNVAEERYKETLFRIRLATSGSGPKNKRKLLKSKALGIKLLHVDTVVAMWTHNDELLPEWALNQQEVSGNKKVQDADNIWTVDEIVNISKEDSRNIYVPKVIKKIPFFKKWWELQMLMFQHNNQLSSEHPFASQPGVWPLALSGVSFWNDNESRKQIFFVGNVVGFWLQVCFLSIYVGLVLADQISRRRNFDILSDSSRSKLYNTLGFLFIGWCAHYFPFYLMNRQKFLHHYLPAHLIAALFSGGLVDFATTDITRLALRHKNKKLIFIVTCCSIGIIWFYIYFSPITYGDISISPEEVQKRQWFDIKLHYAK